MPNVILVDEQDNQIGTEEKLKAHLEGKLHRCFSIFLFNSKGQTLLQQRALDKYHSGGLWSNTCCGHQEPGEETLPAAHRRLKEELGMDCEMKEVFNFTYQANLDHGIREHEFDHVLFGYTDAGPLANPEEVMDWKWIDKDELSQELKKYPEKFTYWLNVVWEKILKHS